MRRWARAWHPTTLVLVAFGISFAIWASPVEAGHGQEETVGVTELHAAGPFPRAHGQADLELVRRHGEVYLTLRKFPRPDIREKVFVLWLVGESGPTGHIGGVFGPPEKYGLSAVVPGKKLGQRHATRAKRLVITLMNRDRLIRVGRKSKRKDWRKKTSIIGKRVVRGRVLRCRHNVCPQ